MAEHYLIFLIIDNVFYFSDKDLELMKRIFCTERKDYTEYVLEKDHDFELCVHSRNFIGGIPIAINIANAVRLSRRTVVFLTE